MKLFYLLIKTSFLVSFVLKPSDKGIDSIDLTIVGYANSADGLGKIPITIIDCLKEDLFINFLPTREIGLLDLGLSKEIKDVLTGKNKIGGNVAFFTDILTFPGSKHYKAIPENALIKIAYTMIEGTKVPKDVRGNNLL